jgi:hypothetical protein
MQRRKSPRHVKAANARWRAAEQRAQAERDEGIPDREDQPDLRLPVEIDLSTWGGQRLRIEPRIGYISGRMFEADAGDLLDCAAMKTLPHRLADSLPRTESRRNNRGTP